MFSPQTPQEGSDQLLITVLKFHQGFTLMYERIFYTLRTTFHWHNLPRNLVPITGSFQDMIGLLDNLFQAFFPVKGWTRWSLGVPSNLGCCTVLWFYDSKFRGAIPGLEDGIWFGLNPTLWHHFVRPDTIFFIVTYFKSDLRLPYPECSMSWWPTYWVCAWNVFIFWMTALNTELIQG